jgi:hypothetical protein
MKQVGADKTPQPPGKKLVHDLGYTLISTLYDLNHTPYVLNPTPYTPMPCILDPSILY